jgi:hypothetical protein
MYHDVSGYQSTVFRPLTKGIHQDVFELGFWRKLDRGREIGGRTGRGEGIAISKAWIICGDKFQGLRVLGVRR